jgi:antitoxin component YwqK of YwqJK toxin-antitoxin module
LVIKATSELQQNQNIINKNGVIHYKGIPFTGILILENQISVGDWDIKMTYYNIKTTYENGVKEGFHGEYYIKSGVLSVETTFINGLLDGKFKKYYRQGELLGIETYKNGIKEGLKETYFRRDFYQQKPNVLRSRYYLKDGKKQGLSESFHENGKLRIKANYNRGEYDGVLEVYYDNGELWMKSLYKNGKIIKDNF